MLFSFFPTFARDESRFFFIHVAGVALLMAAQMTVPAFAAQAASSHQAEHFGPLVVTATRVPTPLDHIGSSVTVINAAEIRRHQWQTVPAILRSVPGVHVVQAGGPGGATSIFIRGTNSNQTKILLDGIVVNDPSKGGATSLGQILTSDIKKIEILRGPQSSLYGSDAIGGVINIITKKGTGPATITASLEGGSFDTFNQNVGVNGSTRHFHYAVNLAHFYSGSTPVTPLDLLPPGRERNNDRYENTTASTRLGYDINKNFGVTLAARYTSSSLDFTAADYSVFPSVPAAKQSTQSDHNLFGRSGVHFSLFDGAFKNWVGVAYTRYRTRVQSPATAFGPVPPTYNRGTRVKYSWQGDIKLAKKQTLVFGLEDQTERLQDSPISAENSNRAVWGEIQSRVIDNFFVAASVRYDHNERFGGKVTWRIAPTYTFASTGTQLKASYGTGFKAPTLTQLFVNFPAFGFYANPNLDPEESTGYDFGFEQPLLNGRIRFGVTAFHNDITNLITTKVIATGTTYANTGSATTYGAESFLSWQPTKSLNFKVNYTYTVAQDDAADLELLRRPRRKASLHATWQPTDRLSLAAAVSYVSSWIDGNRNFTIPRMRAHPYSVTNIKANYTFENDITVFGRIDNLFDRRYENPIGFQHPGRGFFVGVRGRFTL